MAGIRLIDLPLTITKIEEIVDKSNVPCLKVRGYNAYRGINYKGKNLIMYNAFRSIRLYGTEELLQETIRRLSDCKGEKKRVKIICYDCDLTLPIMGVSIVPTLKVYWYDFDVKKFGTKKIMAEETKGENK